MISFILKHLISLLSESIARTKKFIGRGNERERVDFERESSVWVTLRFLDDKVIRPFFFLQSQSYYSWLAKHYNSETCLATARIILEKGQHELQFSFGVIATLG